MGAILWLSRGIYAQKILSKLIFHLPNFCGKSSFVNNTLCTTAAVGRAVDIYEVEISDQHKSYTEID